MKKCKCGLLVWPLLLMCFPSYAAVSGDDCLIDEIMQEQFIAANQQSKNVIDSNVFVPNVEEESCLPDLSDFTSGLTLSVPNFADLIGNLATKIKDLVCDAASASVNNAVALSQQSWNAPYGLLGVQTGLAEGEGGVTVQPDSETSNLLEAEVLNSTNDSLGGGQNILNNTLGNILGDGNY